MRWLKYNTCTIVTSPMYIGSKVTSSWVSCINYIIDGKPFYLIRYLCRRFCLCAMYFKPFNVSFRSVVFMRLSFLVSARTGRDISVDLNF